MKKKIGHTAVSSTKASSVTVLDLAKTAKENILEYLPTGIWQLFTGFATFHRTVDTNACTCITRNGDQTIKIF